MMFRLTTVPAPPRSQSPPPLPISAWARLSWMRLPTIWGEEPESREKIPPPAPAGQALGEDDGAAPGPRGVDDRRGHPGAEDMDVGEDEDVLPVDTRGDLNGRRGCAAGADQGVRLVDRGLDRRVGVRGRAA